MTGMLILFAGLALGLMAGALLAEGAVLVPFWRSVPAESFLGWYRRHGGLLLRFFGPLEVAAAALVVLATISSASQGGPTFAPLAASSLLSLSVLAAFPLYFRRANASFADGSLDPDRLPDELRRWARWHWTRVIASIAAFASALLAALRFPG